MPSWRRLAGVLELALYGPLYIVSGWFADDPGYGSRDPLAREQERIVRLHGAER